MAQGGDTMILTTRIACAGYLLLMAGLAIFGILTSKPQSGSYFIGFIIGQLLFTTIFSVAALATLGALGALGATSHTKLRRASTINKMYLLTAAAAIFAIFIVRATVPYATTFLPFFVLLGLIAMVSIIGLSKAQKQLTVAP
jgi:hypothetical protein